MSSKYAQLSGLLTLNRGRPVTLTLQMMDRLCGGLPPSASAHREWWANDATPYRQSVAWLQAGFRVASVDRSRGVVRFEPN
jgi:hypothetical protein